VIINVVTTSGNPSPFNPFEQISSFGSEMWKHLQRSSVKDPGFSRGNL
jgi:hypothetical protein